MKHIYVKPCSLRIFDGDAAANNGEQVAENQSITPAGKGERAKKGSDAESKSIRASAEGKREEFRKLIEGEYKEAYAKEFQNLFNRRFKDVKDNREKLLSQQPVIDALAEKYGTEKGDIRAILKAMENERQKADNSRKQFEQLREKSKAFDLRRRIADVTAQMNGWREEINSLKKAYSDFTFDQGEKVKIAALLKAGLSLSAAYEATHLSSIKEQIARTSAEKAVAQTVEGIRARGMRAKENGISSQNGITLKTDMSKLTREQRQLLALRASRGEEILL